VARPRLKTDDELLEIARAAFLVHGSRASTGEIAATAGLSEAALFKRFGSKQAMLLRAIEPLVNNSFEGPFPDRLSLEGLVEVGEGLLRHLGAIVPLVLMTMSHIPQCELPAGLHGPEPAPHRTFRAFERYFREQMRIEHIRKVHPAVLARTFIGAIWNFAFMRAVLHANAAPKESPKVFVREHVALLWPALSMEKKQ
jgi:AcrR family transcriptional regulator